MGGIVDSVTSVFKGPPKPPSAGSQIEAQKQATRVNQYTPGGNVEFGNYDAEGNFVKNEGYDSARVTESPEQEFLRKQREEIAKQFYSGIDTSTGRSISAADYQTRLPNVSQFIGGLPQTGTSADVLSNLPQGGDIASLRQGLPGIDTDYTAANQRAADAVYNRGMNYYQPEFENQTSSAEAQLAARGIPVGSEAYAREKDRIERGQGMQRENLALSAIGAGNQEAARLFGQDLQARGQLFGENANIFGLAEGQRGARFGEGMQGLAFDEMQRGARLNEQTAALDAALRKQSFITGVENQDQQLANQRAQLAAVIGQTNPQFADVKGVDAMGAMQSANQAGNQYYQDNLTNLTDFAKFAGGFF